MFPRPELLHLLRNSSKASIGVSPRLVVCERYNVPAREMCGRQLIRSVTIPKPCYSRLRLFGHSLPAL